MEKNGELAFQTDLILNFVLILNSGINYHSLDK